MPIHTSHPERSQPEALLKSPEQVFVTRTRPFLSQNGGVLRLERTNHP